MNPPGGAKNAAERNVVLWLQDKASEAWSSTNIVSLLSPAVVDDVRKHFGSLELDVKIHTLLAATLLRKGKRKAVGENFAALLQDAMLDQDEWVRVMARILRTVPVEGRLSASEIDFRAEPLSGLVSLLDRRATGQITAGRSMGPLQRQYLSASLKDRAPEHEPQPHFRVREFALDDPATADNIEAALAANSGAAGGAGAGKPKKIRGGFAKRAVAVTPRRDLEEFTSRLHASNAATPGSTNWAGLGVSGAADGTGDDAYASVGADGEGVAGGYGAGAVGATRKVAVIDINTSKDLLKKTSELKAMPANRKRKRETDDAGPARKKQPEDAEAAEGDAVDGAEEAAPEVKAESDGGAGKGKEKKKKKKKKDKKKAKKKSKKGESATDAGDAAAAATAARVDTILAAANAAVVPAIGVAAGAAGAEKPAAGAEAGTTEGAEAGPAPPETDEEAAARKAEEKRIRKEKKKQKKEEKKRRKKEKKRKKKEKAKAAAEAAAAAAASSTAAATDDTAAGDLLGLSKFGDLLAAADDESVRIASQQGDADRRKRESEAMEALIATSLADPADLLAATAPSGDSDPEATADDAAAVDALADVAPMDTEPTVAAAAAAAAAADVDAAGAEQQARVARFQQEQQQLQQQLIAQQQALAALQAHAHAAGLTPATLAAGSPGGAGLADPVTPIRQPEPQPAAAAQPPPPGPPQIPLRTDGLVGDTFFGNDVNRLSEADRQLITVFLSGNAFSADGEDVKQVPIHETVTETETAQVFETILFEMNYQTGVWRKLRRRRRRNLAAAPAAFP